LPRFAEQGPQAMEMAEAFFSEGPPNPPWPPLAPHTDGEKDSSSAPVPADGRPPDQRTCSARRGQQCGATRTEAETFEPTNTITNNPTSGPVRGSIHPAPSTGEADLNLPDQHS